LGAARELARLTTEKCYPDRFTDQFGGGDRDVAVTVDRARDLAPDALAVLIAESEREGWRFVRRLADEWADGTNGFDRPGEALFVARLEGSLIGVCGLNADPYTADETTGRVRRLYVLRAHRGRGVGRLLVRAVLAAATGRFQRLRVRTESAEAGRLYQRLGFQPVAGVADCTHTLELMSRSIADGG
jgi:GNAT superfamily N-acetyltransferase